MATPPIQTGPTKIAPAPPADPEPLSARDLAVVAAINLMWGLNIVAVKLSLTVSTPFTTGALRQAIVLLACIGGLRLVPGRMAVLLLVGAVSGGLFLAFVNLSLMFSENVGALAIAGQLGVPFALILGVLFLGEHIHVPRLLGILLAFSGVVLIAFDPAAARDLPGIGLTAVASFLWAIGSLLQRRLSGVPVRTIYAWIGLAGLAILAPLALWLEPQSVRSLASTPIADFRWVAFSAIGSTVIGQGGMAWLLQRHTIATVAPLTLASPVVAVIASSLAFAAPITGPMMLGGALAMAGVAIITVRSARRGVLP